MIRSGSFEHSGTLRALGERAGYDGATRQHSSESISMRTLTGNLSARELVHHYGRLGIPHFQRGLVWTKDSVALLLESLWYETPCGTIMLWPSKDAQTLGIGLGSSHPDYLIVDGQQRIRSLHEVFGPASAEEDATTCWCLNLGAVPELREQFEDGQRFDLFRKVMDPRAQTGRHTKAGKALPSIAGHDALVPLRWYLTLAGEERLQGALAEDASAPIRRAVEAVLANDAARERLDRLAERKLFHVLELDATRSLAHVVETYNRINSAGKRVEAEERAFASLASIYPGIYTDLKEFFSQVEGDDFEKSRLRADRDNLLRRQRENHFGFKLFMRGFMLVYAYHANQRMGTATLSFDAVDRKTLEKCGSHLPAMAATTSRILARIATVLRRDLYCDDFRMLPETTALWPIMQLLVRYPEAPAEADSAIGALILRLMLANLTKNEVVEYCRKVDGTHSLADAFNVFSTLDRRAMSGLEQRLEGSQSLTDRYMLLLYWLLRRRRARDFSYDENLKENAAAFRAKYGHEEAFLSASVSPEKQHIVPYNVLKVVYGLGDSARVGRHRVNDIGNLTYISGALNGWEHGVGEHPLALLNEDENNRDAHFLTDLSGFEGACDKKGTSARFQYESFCNKRRRAIAAAFCKWVEATSARFDASIQPAARISERTPDDQIRALRYERDVNDALIRLWSLGMKEAKIKDADFSLRYRQPKTGKQLFRLDLWYQLPKAGETQRQAVETRKLSLRFTPSWYDQFHGCFATLTLEASDERVKCRFRTPAEQLQIVPVLQWLADRMTASGQAQAHAQVLPESEQIAGV